jgi:hypothetical protein
MRPIPLSIKIEIFRKYLEGFSMPKISKLYNVSVGSIYSITTEEAKKDDAFNYIREIAKKLRKDNIDIYDLIPAIHINTKIKTLGLNHDLFDEFLESADTESFRINMNLDEFLKKVKEILNFERSNNIKFHEILPYIEKEKAQLDKLTQEKERIEVEIINHSDDLGFTRSAIQEYFQQKPLLEEYKKNREAISKSTDWYIYEKLYEKASNEIGITIDPLILYDKLLEIYRYPDQNIELKRMILAL